MSNLFFIHTPMQLFMAQQIIHQEALKDNIMVYDYAGFNSYYQNSYELIVITDMWIKKIINPVRLGWNTLSTEGSMWRSIKEIKRKLKVLVSFIEKEHPSALYFGDMLNQGYRLLAHIFSGKGIKIGFFEEGYSHYTGRIYRHIWRFLIRTLVVDVMVYLPLYHKCLEYKTVYVCRNPNKIPQDVRFSLIPFYKEPFDKLVHPELLMSLTLKKYMDEEKNRINKVAKTDSLVLFINEDIKHYVAKIDAQTEEQLLQEYVFPVVPKDSLFLVKFHPAENEARKNQVRRYFEKNNVPFCVISEDINVPVEYYLQMLKFNHIFTYAMAVNLYNGYLFPHTEITRLLDGLNRVCKKNGITNLGKLNTLISRLDAVQKCIEQGA